MYQFGENRRIGERRRPGSPDAAAKERAFARECLYYFQYAADGMLVICPETETIDEVNQTFLSLSGYTREDIVGKKLGELGALAGLDAGPLFLRFSQGAGRIFCGDQLLTTSDGRRVGVELLCSVHQMEDRGRIVCGIRDVTERKRTEHARVRSEDQFRRLFETNPYAMWVLECDTFAFLAVNGAAVQMYGYSHAEFMSMTMLALHLPGEIDELLRGIGAVRSATLKPDLWRHRKKNGEIIDVELAANDILFNNQKARFVIAIDVTASRQAEDLLRETRRILQDMLSALPVGVAILDSKGACIVSNPAIRNIWGGEPFSGSKGYSADTGKCLEAGEWASTQAVLHGKTTLDEVLVIEGTGGTRKTILNSAVPLQDSRGNIAGAIVVNQDITERRRREEELQRVHEVLRRQATTDGLTGIFNRQKFNELLDRELQKALRYEHPFSLIMFDIDFFKSINDSEGHLAGDAVLREITGLVARSIRKVDVFARWGGEEFVILSPDTAVQSAHQLAEKLRSQIELSTFSCKRAVTCSFGVVQFQEDDDAIDKMISRADFALYKAKANGRNRVESG